MGVINETYKISYGLQYGAWELTVWLPDWEAYGTKEEAQRISENRMVSALLTADAIFVFYGQELLKILDLGLEDRLTSKVGLLSGGESHHRRVEREIGDKADGGQVGGAIFIQRTDQSQRIGGRIDSGLHNVQFSHRVSSFQSDLEIDISSFCWYNYYT